MGENPPLVNSISYGGPEPLMAASVLNTFNTEAMKLGAQGVSIFVSSGDDGVAGNAARGNATACGYEPSFPATSPYITQSEQLRVGHSEARRWSVLVTQVVSSQAAAVSAPTTTSQIGRQTPSKLSCPSTQRLWQVMPLAEATQT